MRPSVQLLRVSLRLLVPPAQPRHCDTRDPINHAVVFETHGLLQGKTATAHPAFEGKLSNQSRIQQRVVVDGNCTTSKGPGTAMEFALSLVRSLYGDEKMKEVAGPMVVHDFKL